MADPIDGKQLTELVRDYRAKRQAASEAERALFDYLWKPLKAFVRSLTHHDASNLAISSIRRFLNQVDTEIPANSKAYAFMIVRNRINEETRRKRPEVVDAEEFEGLFKSKSSVTDEVILRELTSSYSKLVDSMPESDRRIIRVWIMTDDEEETAEQTDTTQAEVRRAVERYEKLVLRWFIG
jgi:DNA-directed RNA polymerase specialized sigma24 family protein